VIRAAISAPGPKKIGASCATTSRPVRRTDAVTASKSIGETERRSMTST
jgi:hypothetical protein